MAYLASTVENLTARGDHRNCLNFCTVRRVCMDTWQLSWETPIGSSVPCEQIKNIERLRVNEVSGAV